MRRFFAFMALIWSALPAAAQVSPNLYDYVRSDLDWYTIETEHFLVHFHADPDGSGSSRSAQVTARIAEEIYGPMTELYGLEPDTKVSIVLKDFEDYSNGAAYFFDNLIEIWAPALNTPLRGAHAWLRNVITHEFAHIVQVQASMKSGRRVPFVYLQYLDYEDVRRPDVLYGYPNVIASYPVPVLNNPAWLAEGTAQYQRASLDYDRWDAHRDMILRTRVLAGETLTIEEMGGFYSHTSLERETVYNQGFALSQYLAATYGEQALADVTRSLGQWSNWNFERAARDAVGRDGGDVWQDWVSSLEADYTASMQERMETLVAGRVLEDDGFYNQYPRFSPDGSRIAWLSNKGEDFSRQYLHIMDVASGEEIAEVAFDVAPGHVCALGHRLAGPATGAVTWSPDGGSVVYTRSRETPEGRLFNDLYSYSLEEEKSTRITREQRLSDPAWSPDGDRIAAVRQSDGTTNIVLLDPASGEVAPLTAFASGQQATEPRFSADGAWVYFSQLDRHGYDLARVRAQGGSVEQVLATESDERSPVPSTDGVWFASDRDGIFNLYRLRDGASAPERMTNVVGGAFMPDVAPGGQVAFARYDWDGYSLALLENPQVVGSAPAYTPPRVLTKANTPSANSYDDSDLGPIARETLNLAADSSGVELSGLAWSTDSDRAAELSEYSSVFTSFSFLPVLRLDRYVSRKRSRTDVRIKDRTRGETLLRNTKIGAYAASREIMNGLTMFGGLLLAPGSRAAESPADFFSPSSLLKLERDLFLQFELRRSLGILDKRWAPQWSLELFNVRRNVENGLSIEEFPCTACYPDTTLADLAYNLWEVDLAARSKINRALLLEAGVRYSPYRVTTERFFSKELAQAIPETSSRYFIGRSVRLKAYFEAFEPHRHMDVVPEGIKVEATLERERGRLLEEFDVEDGILTPVYTSDAITRLTLDARVARHLVRRPLPHGISARVRTSMVLGGEVNDFYDDYIGGLTGARGYPFYALGGNRTAWAQMAYTFPLLPRIDRQMGFLYADKLFARVYADAVSAWRGAFPGAGSIRKDVGAELRLGLGSFYLLPTAVFVSGTYGLDTFDFQLDDGFVTPDGQSTVQYGGGVQWHVGVLFGFDLF
ncbi:MAG: PD40 domain-containing protein [Rhodothermales bacterium]|nr:PD40 domain-containing protein [Rhodothermales bacterium]MBO6780585.1 PD40 domain-containing protein [Rhodothermales bacterium]